MRRVEGEHPRLDFADREVAFGARQTLAEQTLWLLAIGIRHQHEALAESKRRLDRVRQPRAVRVTVLTALQHDAVDHDLERMLLHLVERDVLAQVADAPVYADAREAAAARGHEQLLVLALPVPDQRSEDQETRALLVFADLVDYLLDGLRHDRDSVVRTVRHADAREQQTKMVVDLRDGPDSRSRVPRRALLIDRDRR